jgi:hypothetical protein
MAVPAGRVPVVELTQLADRYGLVPEGPPIRVVEEALRRYRNKKHIVFPHIPHEATIDDLLLPDRSDITEDDYTDLLNRSYSVLSHAYGEPEVFATPDRDYITTTWRHPTDRIPLGKIAGFRMTAGGRHAVAKIPYNDGNNYMFNTGYQPTPEECEKYNLREHSYGLQKYGTCGLWSALRLAESHLSDKDFIRKLETTVHAKKLPYLDVIPSRIFKDIDLERIEKSDFPRILLYKKGGLIKNPVNRKMRHQMTEVPLVEKAPRKLLGGEGGKKQSLKDGGVVEKIKRGVKKAKDVLVESATQVGMGVKKGVKEVGKVAKKGAEEVGKAVVKIAKKHSHKLVEGGKEFGKNVGKVVGRAGATALHVDAGQLGEHAGGALGEEIGRRVGEKLHEKIQSLKKGGKVKKLKSLAGETEAKLSVITDIKPMKAKKPRAKKAEVVIVEEVVVKKPRAKKMKEGGEVKAPAKKSSAWLDHVKAYRAKNGGTYMEAMKSAKASYKK